MNRNSKIFIGLAIFLFCSAFAFKFTLGEVSSFEFMWTDMIALVMGLMAATVAMIILVQKAKKEDSLDDELELKELSRRVADKFEDDEFV